MTAVGLINDLILETVERGRPVYSSQTQIVDAERAWIGRDLRRVEDDRLVRGDGLFVGDIGLLGGLHLVFLRSPIACGAIQYLDVSAAAAVEGVVAIFVGSDTASLGSAAVNPLLPGMRPPTFPLLTGGRIEALGQPLAVVVARSVDIARDAVEQITLRVATTDPRGRSDDDRVIEHHWTKGDVGAAFAKAAHIVEARINHAKLAPAPMEPRAAAAAWSEADAQLTVWLATQTPHRCRDDIAVILRLEPEKVRVIAPDVGGAFGGKASLYPEDAIVAWVAMRLKCPIEWSASRSEDFLSATQGRGGELRGRLAFDSEGRATALEAHITYPVGYWMPYSAASPARNAGRILPGPYLVGAVSVALDAYLTNTAPMNIYRGAGRPEATLLMERLMDLAASACGLDPVEIRRRNLIPPDLMPYNTPTGERLDSGRYDALLAETCRKAGYAGLCERRDDDRRSGKISGVGVSFYVEPCGQGWESATIGLAEDGRIVACTGSTAQGQGRETAFAQIVADALGVDFERITIRHGDTSKTPPGIGALASRSTAIGGSALLQAARLFLVEARRAAARLLECPDDMLAPVAEGFVALVSGRCIDWRQLAAADGDKGGLSLAQSTVFHAEGEAWSSGCCIASVTIDGETGETTIDSLTFVDDAGRIVNPLLVEGQLIGGMAQGFGEAFLERIVYDDDGQLVTGSFMDYAMPRATDIPSVKLGKMETLATVNPLGAKGVGEAGCIGVPACLMNAVLDALSPFGVTQIDMPMTSQAIWRAMNAKSQNASASKGAIAA